MIFALTGLQIYRGILRNKCVAEVPPFTPTPSYSYVQYWNDWTKDTSKFAFSKLIIYQGPTQYTLLWG